jgi:PhnB protein
MSVSPIPKGWPAVIPCFSVKGAARLRDFLVQVFDARIDECYSDPSGTIHHAEAWIGSSLVMFGEGSEQYGFHSGAVYVYVPDCDATYRRALAAGATSVSEPATQFYGDRNASVKDPFGNQWSIGTHVEDVSHEECERRMKAKMGSGGGCS